MEPKKFSLNITCIKISKKLLAGAFIVFAAWMLLSSEIPSTEKTTFATEKGSREILIKIYQEVKDLGAYPGEDFIHRDFWVGADDDDTNKDIHVVVLIQSVENKEKMKIQVTYMESSSSNSKMKYAKETKNIVCLVNMEKIELLHSDYSEKELTRLTSEILQAIQNKKNLLRLKMK